MTGPQGNTGMGCIALARLVKRTGMVPAKPARWKESLKKEQHLPVLLFPPEEVPADPYPSDTFPNINRGPFI